MAEAGPRAFVVGHPIAHSRSPLIHGHWLREHGIAGSYERVDVAPDRFEAFLSRLAGSGFVGGNITQFIDMPSILIVIGGASAATLVRFPLAGIGGAFVVGSKVAFTHKKSNPRDLIEEITRVAEIVRQKGPIALENVDVANPFLGQGLRFVADGYDREFVRETLEKETDNFLERLGAGLKVYRAMGDAAPAWGMIGTVLGLVIMMSTPDR